MNSLEKYLENNDRMDVVGQNGNDDLHYITEDKALDRKRMPVYSGVVAYFPFAMQELAKCSYQGQIQHNPDKPLAWDRSKSGDELDAMMRHLTDHAQGIEIDDDGIRHIVKCGWRILAYIQKTMEDKNK